MITIETKPARRIDLAKMPLEQRMKRVKAVLTSAGYAVEGFTLLENGRVYLRIKPHAVGGGYERARVERKPTFTLVDGAKF